MTSMLAFALAVSTLAVPTAAADPHACCKRMGAHVPVHALQCCMPDRPEQSSRQAPPSRSAVTPAPDLTPLPGSASIAPPALLPVAPPIDRPGSLVAPPHLYLLHATLIV